MDDGKNRQASQAPAEAARPEGLTPAGGPQAAQQEVPRDDGADGTADLFGAGCQEDQACQVTAKIQGGGPKLSLAERMVENEWAAVVALDLSDATRAAIRATAMDEARRIVRYGPRSRQAIFRAFLRGFMLGTVGPRHWNNAERTAKAARRATFAAARARKQQARGMGTPLK